jgi:hypothetical protein
MLESYALPGLVPNAVLKCKDACFLEKGPYQTEKMANPGCIIYG